MLRGMPEFNIIALENLGLQKKRYNSSCPDLAEARTRLSEDKQIELCNVGYKCKCMEYAWSLKLDILKFDTHVIYLFKIFLFGYIINVL